MPLELTVGPRIVLRVRVELRGTDRVRFSSAASPLSLNGCYSSTYALYLTELLITAASADLTVDDRNRVAGVDAATNYNMMGVQTQQADGPTRAPALGATVATFGSISTTGTILSMVVAKPAAAAATVAHLLNGNNT